MHKSNKETLKKNYELNQELNVILDNIEESIFIF